MLCLVLEEFDRSAIDELILYLLYVVTPRDGTKVAKVYRKMDFAEKTTKIIINQCVEYGTCFGNTNSEPHFTVKVMYAY